MGRRHRAFYRITAVDQRRPRDGRVIEDLGYFDPINKDEAKQVQLDEDRARYWLSVGAQPTERVHSILRSRGLLSSQWRRDSGKPAPAAAEQPPAT
jgi:small subunit ribosomal protein S16